MLKNAADLVTTHPPGFPVAVAHSLNTEENLENRDESIFISNHGLVILAPDRTVQHLQVVGTPRDEFAMKYHELLQKYVLKDSATAK